MEFGILGPLQIADGGDEVEIRAAKLRTLLAVLLVRRGSAVSRAAIVEALWGDRPADGAEATVQVYVSRLRRILRFSSLTTGPAGYALAIAPEALDAARFEALAAEGRSALRAAEPHAAATALARALALWRGPALSEFRGEAWADGTAARLDELRLAVLEDRIDADLGCGRAAELVPELELLVAEHPLHEQLCSRLMLGLYRSGRQADALRAYAALRERLVDELGIVPSRPLQQLEQAMLLQAAELDLPAPPPARSDRGETQPAKATPAPLMGERVATAAVLMTDIEGSTGLLRRLGDGYEVVLADHHRAVRAAAARWGGLEISSAGDGFTFLFSTVDTAVSAAVDVQNDLAGGPAHVRAAVHAGPVVTTPVGPVGMVLHECARLLPAASGGQVLVSPAAHGLLRPPPMDIAVVDLGVCQLRDIDDPWPVWEVLRRGGTPVGTLRTSPWGSLPETETSFVGRQHELERVIEQASHRRLITLTGPGGIGKTRLAIEAARRLAVGGRSGAALVELAGVRDGAAVPMEVLRSLRPSAAGVRDPTDVLAALLGASDLVLVLDNCEHVVAAAGQLADRLASSCPALVVLATSREPLGVPRELLIPVSFLDAVATGQLLVDRASDIDPAAAAALAASDQLSDIAARLEGVPLAVELAAARLGSLTVAELAEGLARPLGVLAGASRHGDSRQRTMRATLDWSWELLEPDDQRLLCCLAPFTAWFGPEDAAAVADIGSGDARARLERLCSKSLVVFDREGQQGRFRLLEPVRQYTKERLTNAGHADETHSRFVALQVRAAEERRRALYAGGTHVVAAFPDRRGDIAHATGLAVDADDAVSAMRLIDAAGFPWAMTDPAEGLRLAERVRRIEQGDEPALVRAGFAFGSGLMAIQTGELATARPLLDDAIAGFRALGFRRREAWALYYRVQIENPRDRQEWPERRQYWLERALTLFDQPPSDPLGVTIVQLAQGGDLLFHDRLAEARAVLECGLQTATNYDVTNTIGSLLCQLGLLDAREGYSERAFEQVAEGVTLCGAVGDRWSLVNALIAAAQVENLVGEPQAATGPLIQSVRLAVDRNQATFALLLAADVLLRRPDQTGAACSYDFARRIWPPDQDSFDSVARYFTTGKSSLEELPRPRTVTSTTLREKLEWVAQRLAHGAG